MVYCVDCVCGRPLACCDGVAPILSDAQMSVDLERRHDLGINIDFSFHTVPCAVLSLDVLDISGTNENDVSFATGMSIHKHRLDAAGNKVGKAEYITPQSQHVMSDGMGGQMMNVNIPQAMKVGENLN